MATRRKAKLNPQDPVTEKPYFEPDCSSIPDLDQTGRLKRDLEDCVRREAKEHAAHCKPYHYEARVEVSNRIWEIEDRLNKLEARAKFLVNMNACWGILFFAALAMWLMAR